MNHLQDQILSCFNGAIIADSILDKLPDTDLLLELKKLINYQKTILYYCAKGAIIHPDYLMNYLKYCDYLIDQMVAMQNIKKD